MFSMCEQFKWNVFPVAGGLYDQNPVLLDHWWIIIAERNEYQAKEQKKQERQRKAKTPSMGTRARRNRG